MKPALLDTDIPTYFFKNNIQVVAKIDDCLIAATAVVNNMRLITNNTAHYSRIKGLVFENWLI